MEGILLVLDRKQLLVALAGDPKAIPEVLMVLAQWLGQPALESLRSILFRWSALNRVDLPQLLLLLALCALPRFAKAPHPSLLKLQPVPRLTGTAVRWSMEGLEPIVRRAIRRFVWPFRTELRSYLASKGEGVTPHRVQAGSDELVHDVMTKLLVEMKLARWDPERGSINTFIWATSVNAVIDRLRTESKEHRMREELLAESTVEPGTCQSTERVPPVDIERFKGTLQERDQAIYADYYEQGFNAEEIAEKLGMKLSNVQYRIYMLGKKIRKFFGLDR